MRCAAVVTHGGSGTTLGALAHGLALVLVPQVVLDEPSFGAAARALQAEIAAMPAPEEASARRRGVREPRLV